MKRKKQDEQLPIIVAIKHQEPQPNFISSTSLSTKFINIKCFSVQINTN